MKKTRVLFVTQEIQPFLPENEISKTVRTLTQGIQEAGKEIRTFTPKFGSIKERRHQLHEVIRLSGMNLIVDDTDHPLIIKVASVPAARMQVYFIDNEEYFKRKNVLVDDEGKFFEDNDERSMFFCRGVLETVKKLGWQPDIIHCHGWMTALMPLYIKKMYNTDPHFAESKVVYTPYEKAFEGKLDANLGKKLAFDGFDEADIEGASGATHADLTKIAAKFSDAFSYGSANIDEEVVKTIEAADKPCLDYQGEVMVPGYSEFYDSITETVLAE